MKRSFLLVLLTVVVAIVLLALGAGAVIRPVQHEALTPPRIYAYRDWQSVGLYLHAGDTVHIRAQGSWTYTPGEFHGPEGHARYQAPSFYPLPGVRGGALIGRIGETGAPFYVGRRTVQYVNSDGLLYLRIDDDILSDNEGFVTVEVSVTQATE
jgi:hypothetical protein